MTAHTRDVVEPLRRALEGVRPGSVWVAYSGGIDSTAMLVATAELTRGACRAVHIHHGLHPDADVWAGHVQTTSAHLGVEVRVLRVDIAAGNVEARAREARYAVFEELLREGDVLLLAHHADDHTETLLLRIFSGRGWLAMPVSRALGAGSVLRPWRDVSRADIERYVRDHDFAARGLGWIEDPANADTSYDRNYLRHEVLPHVRERWPRVDAALLREDGVRGARDALLRHWLSEWTCFEFERLLKSELGDEALLNALRLWLECEGCHGLSDRRLGEFLRQCRESAGQPALTVDERTLRVHEGRFYLVSPTPVLEPEYAVGFVDGLDLPHGRLEFEATQGEFPGDGRLSVRFRRGGETLERGGKRVALKQVFQNAKVPPWQRDTWPLLYCGDELVALPGLAYGDAAIGWRATWNFH